MTGPEPDEPRDDTMPPTHQPYGQEPAPPPQPGQQPWSPPPYQPYQGPYGPAPGYGYPRPPAHPQATTSLALGIASLAGLLFCQLLLVLGPFAWAIGSRACAEIDAAPGQWEGRDRANAGRIMGIVATGLLALVVLAAIALVVLFTAFGTWESFDSDDTGINALAALSGAA